MSQVNPTTGRISITEVFGEDLANILGTKIKDIYSKFDSKGYFADICTSTIGKTYTERIVIHAQTLHKYLPDNYREAITILLSILGDENPSQTGMFTNYYWIMPIGKYVELYGLDDFDLSINAISEITKRNTGEYAIRPFARRYPERVIEVAKNWAMSENFHLRRLASEGLRPKLPWSPKLDVWNDNPTPVFEILELLKEDTIMFVKKSVANHLRDWLKVNPVEAGKIKAKWSKSSNPHTQWILKYAQR